MSLSTHVLDTSLGEPAPGVPVRLEWQHDDGWIEIAAGTTVADISPAPQGVSYGRLMSSVWISGTSGKVRMG